MNNTKLDIATAALACALSNKTAVERKEQNISRINSLKNDRNVLYIPRKSEVKTHISQFIKYER